MLISIHSIIFLYTWRSSRRVIARANTNEIGATSRSSVFNDREKSLLKHMIFMIIVYVIGWIPLYIGRMFVGHDVVQSTLINTLMALPILSCWINMIDMLVYHREMRQLVRERTTRFIRTAREKISTSNRSQT